MSKKELEAKTRDELRIMAREANIKGRGTMTKAQLVDALCSKDVVEESVECDDAVDVGVTVESETDVADGKPEEDEDAIDACDGAEHALNNRKILKDAGKRKPKKKVDHSEFVETAAIGSLVAFEVADEDGVKKCRSAKIVNRSTKNKKLKLETAYGAVFTVDYDDVIWVRAGDRWPRWVYNRLKGVSDEQ